MNMRLRPFYWNIAKRGINHSVGLSHYLKEAVFNRRNHELASAISPDDWLYFNSVNPQNNEPAQYVATITEDLKGFNISLRYEDSIRQVSIVPTSFVFNNDTIKKFHLDLFKPKKSSTVKTKPKTKSNTAKTRKRTRTKRTKSTKRTKKGRKAAKSPKRKAKK